MARKIIFLITYVVFTQITNNSKSHASDLTRLQKYCHILTKKLAWQWGKSLDVLKLGRFWQFRSRFQASFVLILAAGLNFFFLQTKQIIILLRNVGFYRSFLQFNTTIKSNGVAEHGLNKVQCHYISSLRAVEFLITSVINFFKHWRVVFQSLQTLAAFSVQRKQYWILILDFLIFPQVSQPFRISLEL